MNIKIPNEKLISVMRGIGKGFDSCTQELREGDDFISDSTLIYFNVGYGIFEMLINDNWLTGRRVWYYKITINKEIVTKIDGFTVKRDALIAAANWVKDYITDLDQNEWDRVLRSK